jgi:tRNA-dihydrouridine synthase 1
MGLRNDAAFAFLGQFGDHPICLAPMIDVNDLPFRLMVRRYGISLCWTGMINANQWNMSRRYRTLLQLSDADRPLVCQISGAVSSDIVSCAQTVASFSGCVAIDLNLGCCVSIAKRSGFGFYMVETEGKRHDALELIGAMATALPIPLFVKMRMLDDESGVPSLALTVGFAQAIERAGAKLITVHGRSRRQDKSGDTDLALIRAIVDAVGIPVIANGGISSVEGVAEALVQTGAAAVMVGQALLRNPRLFAGVSADRFDIAREYLDLAAEYNGPFEAARKHLFYFLDEALGDDSTARAKLGTARSMAELAEFISYLRDRRI